MERIDLNQYEKEVTCTYKNETYSVRDNGAIFRHRRIESRLRPLDEKWTFGKPNHNGYMHICSQLVHRIVAMAFHGEPPTSQHLVDHIDTNRQNNRPENLRWLTKLENTLKNPITRKRIEFRCGSIDAFLKDPSILKDHINEDPNFDWMRTVTPEEAQISWQRLSNWAKKENDSMSSKGGSLGEWIFEDNRSFSSSKVVSEFVASQTPNAVQKDWKTSSEFPLCPKGSTDNSIYSYTANLRIGEIFSRNKYSHSIILDYA